MNDAVHSPRPHAVVLVTRDPLRRVAGLPLLARNVLTAAEAGAAAVTIVAPGPAAELAPALARIRRSRPDLSLHVAGDTGGLAPGAAGWWLHTDGVFTAGHLRALAAAGPGRWRPAAGDRPLAWLEAGQWRAVAAAPDPWRALAQGLADLGAAAPGYHRLDAAADRRPAEAMLFAALGKASDGLVSRLLNRPLSTRVSRWLSRYEISPGQLTALTGACGLAMFAAFLAGGPYAVLAGCLLFQLASVVDGLDGEIARVKFLTSPAGAAWDTAVDMATNLLFLAGLMTALYASEGELYLYLGSYLVGVAAAAMALMTVLLRLGPGGGSFDVLGRALRLRFAGRPRLQQLIGRLETCFKRDCYAFLAAVLALAGQAAALPWLLAAGVTLWLLTIVTHAPYLVTAPAAALRPEHLRRPGRP